ncbi:hypothetical protein [Sphingomonas sp. 3-13AW]|uniref:hypothetical protein n=1 Tax=Sphingomonas sp. 3-13AW TaxID=3050450 RepID=UPI003BB59079
MSEGFCKQNHFPAVAQPFKVLWAPWPLAVLGLGLALFFTLLLVAVGLMTIAMFGFPLFVAGFHVLAIVLGLKMRYAMSIVFSLDNRKVGSSNLGGKGSHYFSNI